MKTNITEKRKLLDFRLKNNRRNKKLIPKETKLGDLLIKKHKKNMHGFKLHWKIPYCSFWYHWNCFNFCFLALFIDILIVIGIFAVGLKVCTITWGIEELSQFQ